MTGETRQSEEECHLHQILSGTNIVDESHDHDTTDLHKCVSFITSDLPVPLVRAVSLSHQVTGSKQPLSRFCGGKACLGFSLPQTPLMWEPPALGLLSLILELTYRRLEARKQYLRSKLRSMQP
ncbi:uncharacterized protein [Miscanthus floridulus]|uniref:uncharacterized protein isoform X2 n=1 Tax=Miscanthus floridulus TaxID=154761 RepID=UPI00345792AC